MLYNHDTDSKVSAYTKRFSLINCRKMFRLSVTFTFDREEFVRPLVLYMFGDQLPIPLEQNPLSTPKTAW